MEDIFQEDFKKFAERNELEACVIFAKRDTGDGGSQMLNMIFGNSADVCHLKCVADMVVNDFVRESAQKSYSKYDGVEEKKKGKKK